MTAEEYAAERLAAECPVRLCPALHRCRRCIHCVAAGSRRVCHYHRAEDVPPDAAPTLAQEDLWLAQSQE